MGALEIVIIAVVAAFGLLALGGAAAARRRREQGERHFRALIADANRDLASARAQDHGWDPQRMEAAARAAFSERRPGESISSLALVQVVDPPGTDEDKAVFQVAAGDGTHRLTLGRRGDDWVLEDLA
jgi:hypothetical protein